MVQTMETWIAADLETLRSFYGAGFKAGELTRRDDLEHEPRVDLARHLKRATEGTRRAAYHKIHHAERLLQLIDRSAVRRRCPSCDRLFRTLHALCGG